MLAKQCMYCTHVLHQAWELTWQPLEVSTMQPSNG